MGTIDASKMTVTDDKGRVIREGKKDEAEEGRFYWWKASDSNMAQEITATVKFIQNHQPTRVEQLTASTRLYGNSSAFNFIGPALSRSASSSATSNSNRISFNLCSSVVDTLVSKIAKNKVIPTFITSGGIWGMQKKAEQLSKFVEGMFYDQDIHKKGVYAFKDAGMWGTGVLHIFEEEDEIRVERVLPHEILVDQIESLNAYPQQMHRVKLVDRDILLNLFGDDEEAIAAIAKASQSQYINIGNVGTAADLLTVTESWHLKSGKEATDGLHAITLEDTVLFKEEYNKNYYPFAFIHYVKRPLGFWGQGACERLQNLQAEINRLMILIQRSMWMGGSFKILSHVNDKIPVQHFNNDVAPIIKWAGEIPPQYIAPQIIQQDIYPYVDALIAKGYQQEGVSQLAASSLKPQGVDSGSALRTFDAIADDRFLFTGQEMEEFYLEIARQMIDVAKSIYSKKKSFKVMFPQTTFVESIDWADIKLKEDEYIIKAFPTSSLPDDPAGKLQTIQEYMQAGLISPMAGRRLLAMPDVEMSDTLANAAEDLLHKTFEEILHDDIYKAPEPEWNLGLAMQLYGQYYNYAELNNCPQGKMDMLRQWKSQLDDLMGLTIPPSPVPMPGPQGQAPIQPMAGPTPTPTSPLLQNTQNAPVGQ